MKFLTWDENKELYYYTANREMTFLKLSLFLFLTCIVSLILAVCARPHTIEQSNACFILSIIFAVGTFAALGTSISYNIKHKKTLEFQFAFNKAMMEIISSPKNLKHVCKQLEQHGEMSLRYLVEGSEHTFKFTKGEFEVVLLEHDMNYNDIVNDHKKIMKQLGGLSELPPLMC